MEIKNGHDLKAFLETLTEEQLDLPVMFDTEARCFDYHMAKVGRAYCEDQDGMGDLAHINLQEG